MSARGVLTVTVGTHGVPVGGVEVWLHTSVSARIALFYGQGAQYSQRAVQAPIRNPLASQGK